MKLLHRLKFKFPILGKATLLVSALCAAHTASANPFASCVTVTNGTVQFYINESGGSVTVTYEDGSTNATFNGVTTGTNVPSGLQSFALNGHTGYSITCHKNGTGTPFQINSGGGAYYAWGTPRGVDANKNPKIGSTFGRVYNGEGGTDTSNLRYRGVYMLSPDLSTNLAPGGGTNPMAGGVWSLASVAGSTSAPYHITVGPDGNVYVADYATADATVYQFDPTFSQYTNVVLGPIGENQGYAAGTHGDPPGVFVTGSLSTSNLVVYTFDPDLPIPYAAALWYVDSFGNNIFHTGSEGQTTPGFFNNVLKYNIGSGLTTSTNSSTNVYGGLTLWTNAPNMGVCLGLPTFQDSQIGDVAVETNGYVVAEYPRANFSDGDIQVYDTNFNLIYTSLQPNGTDPFNNTGSRAYGGVRISPDNQYLLSVTINNQINVCFLTNGIPDVSSMIVMNTVSATGNSRGCAFDAADNIIFNSSGAGKLEYYSLGYTSTTVYTNDITGTNGAFFFSLPPVTASLAISQATASQNYGTPTPAVFSISLNTNSLSVPVTVNYSLTGPATNGVNFTINTGPDANGVIIKTNSVTFPAGTYPSGNWTTTVTITPTASPVSGPTFVESLILNGGTTYIPAEPVSGYITILNTGPQTLLLSASSTGSTLNRAVANDYAEFIITRYGDVSVPSYTVTNINYGGTAVFGVDFTAGAQSLTTTPVDGSPGITIYSGGSSFTNIIGNPVPRTNPYQTPTNVLITLSLANAVTGTTLTSSEGVAYTVNPATVTLTELDNAIGAEVVLWSNPLTNAADSVNWTVTFASTALNTNTVLPVVVPNYLNTSPDALANGGTNDYQVTFGHPVAADGISPSAAMTAKGWTTALKATVENGIPAPAGVNIFPQGVICQGNYAVRFSMYLQLFDRAVNNPYYSGTVDRQYAVFGIDTKGTNCDWRPAANVVPGTGSGMTNSDGIWFAIDAGIDAQTPADFDGFTSPKLPNSGPTTATSSAIADFVSNTGEANSGIFKDPPFGGVISRYGTFGGEPVNQWVDVSVETSSQTNISLYMNRSLVLTAFSITNAGPILGSNGTFNGSYTNGLFMLGYENPLYNVSDDSAFVYYSNVRVVELSPYLTAQPLGSIISAGQNVSFTSSANFATAPLTNTWYLGYTNAVVAVQSNSVAGTNLTATLSLTNVLSGTNYYAVFADQAGSVTSLVASVEVITGPTSITAPAGSIVTFSVAASGQSAPTSYQWKFNGANVSNGTTYAGATTAALSITNVLVSGTYSCVVANPAGSVTNSALLTVVPPTPPVIGSATLVGTNMVFSFSSLDPLAATGKFKVLSSPVVTGPYTTNSAAVITGSAGSYQIVVPTTTNATMFYRLEDVN